MTAAYGNWGMPVIKEQPPPVFPDCFVCGEPFNKRAGSYLFCTRHPGGSVRWSSYVHAEKELRTFTHWNGVKIYFTDFTNPDAPSSPA
jgi:hypothetical protein